MDILDVQGASETTTQSGVKNNGEEPELNLNYPKHQPVQMRLPRQTLQQIDNLKKNTSIDNRTKLVCSSVELADFIVTTIVSGGKAYIEGVNGNKEEINITPLKKNFYF